MKPKIEIYAGWEIEKKGPGTYFAKTKSVTRLEGGRTVLFSMWSKKRIRKFLAERAYPPRLGEADRCSDYATPERAKRFYTGLLDETNENNF